MVASLDQALNSLVLNYFGSTATNSLSYVGPLQKNRWNHYSLSYNPSSQKVF